MYLQRHLLQINLAVDFGFEDDVVIERLREAMHELRSQGLGYPGPPPQDELPQKPFGMIPSELKYPPIEKELGLRTGFSDKVLNKTRTFINRRFSSRSHVYGSLVIPK